jgi:hypothetical protein
MKNVLIGVIGYSRKKLFELVYKYWAQITVLIGITFGGFGFLLSLYFNWTIKKERNYV